MTIEAGALAIRISEEGADQVSKKLDALDTKAKKLGATPVKMPFTGASSTELSLIDRQLDQLGKQIPLYKEGTKHAATKAQSLKELGQIEHQLRGIVAGSNTTLEQNIGAHKQLAQLTSGAPARVGAMSSAWKSFGTTLAAIGIAVSVEKIVGSLVSIVTNAINAGDALFDLAQRTGISTESLSVLQQEAAKSDISSAQLSVGFRNLSKEVEKLRAGNREATVAFGALGLSAADLKGLNLEQVFLKIADAQAKFDEGTGKNAVMTRIFGKAGEELIPVLKNMADGGFDRARAKAEALGGVIGPEFAAKANAFNDSVADMKTATAGLGISIADKLLPSLDSWIDRMTTLITKGKPFLAAFLAGAGSVLLGTPHRVGETKAPGPTIRGLEADVGAGLEGGEPETGGTKPQLSLVDPLEAEKKRVAAINERIGALVSLASAWKLTRADMELALDTDTALKAEYDKGTTSLKRRAEIMEQIGKLSAIVVQPLRAWGQALKDIHPPPMKLVGLDITAATAEAREMMRIRGGRRETLPFKPPPSVGAERVGAVLSDLIARDTPAAQAAIDEIIAKVSGYVAEKKPIPISVAVDVEAIGQKAEAVKSIVTDIGMAVGQAFGSAFQAAFSGEDNFFEAFGKALLASIGSILMSLGASMIAYGAIVTPLLGIPGPWQAFGLGGAASIAAGIALTALGAGLGAVGGGGGKSGGTGAAPKKKEEPNEFAVAFDPDRKLHRAAGSVVSPSARGLGTGPMPEGRPMVVIGTINSLSPDDAKWQRAVADTYTNARNRGLVRSG